MSRRDAAKFEMSLETVWENCARIKISQSMPSANRLLSSSSAFCLSLTLSIFKDAAVLDTTQDIESFVALWGAFKADN